MGGRFSRVVAAVGLIVGSIGTLAAYFAFAKRCDDGCEAADNEGARWINVSDSGEWTGQFLLSLAGFVLLLMFNYLRTRKPEAAWMMFVLSVAAYTAWTLWFLTW